MLVESNFKHNVIAHPWLTLKLKANWELYTCLLFANWGFIHLSIIHFLNHQTKHND